MDYFYQDQIRWNFGFENPNHAAALIASLLPFLWLLGRVGNLRSRPLRLAWKGLAGGALLAGWFLLGLTVSRSGLVAAVGAFVWIGFRTFAQWRHYMPRMVVWVLACGALAMVTGILPRTAVTALEPDASATNRLVLWRGGLEMLAIAPGGVGEGNSGAFFMNWLQPLESQAGYRTMVNSYLTFLTERGILAGAVVGFVFLAILLLCQPKAIDSPRTRDAVIACHASLIAFAVAGFFSTTMETGWVWVPVLLASGLLLGLTLRRGYASHFRPRIALGIAGVLAVGLVMVLWGTGWVLQKKNPQVVHYDGETLEIRNRHPEGTPVREVLVRPDESVMGATYGKGVRLLLHGKRLAMTVGTGASSGDATAQWGVAAGGETWSAFSCRRLILLAPEAPSDDATRELLDAHETILIFLPGYDEDGRVAYWRETAQANPEKIQIIPLAEFGNDLTQAWPEITRHLQSVLRIQGDI